LGASSTVGFFLFQEGPMPTERIAMRRVREMLRLILDAGLSASEAARRMGVARSTLREAVQRFGRSGLTWPLPLDLMDADLETRLYGEAGTKQGHRRRAEPDWAALNREMKRKHVTLQILWDEYIEARPDGYRYSRFCDLYRGWEARLPVTMRQTHLGGDKLFVDYAGDTVPVIVDRRSGETRAAHLFVAVMGGSSLGFAHASWTETLPDWIDAHVRAFAFFGGAPRLLVPDNPKVAVIKACFYDPQVNRTYGEMAAHYDTALLPARPRRPRDKAKVEAAVGFVERWMLGRLRHRRFYSLAEVNTAIAEMLTALNDHRVMRHVGRTRRQLFEEIDAPKLRPCRPSPMPSPSGVSARSASTIMSTSRPTSTPSRIDTPAPPWRCAPPFAPSRSSSRARGSPPTCAARATASTPPCLNTCPPAIAATPTGPLIGSCARPTPSALRRACSAG
jgi:transposase